MISTTPPIITDSGATDQNGGDFGVLITFDLGPGCPDDIPSDQRVSYKYDEPRGQYVPSTYWRPTDADFARVADVPWDVNAIVSINNTAPAEYLEPITVPISASSAQWGTALGAEAPAPDGDLIEEVMRVQDYSPTLPGQNPAAANGHLRRFTQGTVISGVGLSGTHAVHVRIPAAALESRPSSFYVELYLRSPDGTKSSNHFLVAIDWSPHDLNRDGCLNYDDVCVGAERVAEGTLSVDQLEQLIESVVNQ